jgi:hypothetical protein
MTVLRYTAKHLEQLAKPANPAQVSVEIDNQRGILECANTPLGRGWHADHSSDAVRD